MSINSIKHYIGEINGIRCTIVETGCSAERAAFLKDILDFNGFKVQEIKEISEKENEEQKYTIGVTDILFNPVYAIYERRLKTRDGLIITPAYWKQEANDCDPRYWIKKKSIKKVAE